MFSTTYKCTECGKLFEKHLHKCPNCWTNISADIFWLTTPIPRVKDIVSLTRKLFGSFQSPDNKFLYENRPDKKK